MNNTMAGRIGGGIGLGRPVGAQESADNANLERMSPMYEALACTEKALAGLRKSLDLLAEKLNPVCSPSIPTPSEIHGLGCSPEHSAVVSMVLAHNSAIDRFTAEMNILRESVEV
jgi:hypothetical protein